MPFNGLDTPVVANNLAVFGPGTAGKSAQLNYNVPLPGAYSWDRIVNLEMPDEWFEEVAARTGVSLLDMGLVQGDEGRLTGLDHARLAQFYRKVMPATARPSLRLVAEVGGEVAPLLTPVAADPRRAARGPLGAELGLKEVQERVKILNEPDDVEIERIRVDSYIQQLATSQSVDTVGRGQPMIALPGRGIGNSVLPIQVDPVARAKPMIALVETWELRSFLGDYGLGRTLQTFSLLPGERTSITAQTWRTDATTREDASSIFDSSDTAAQTRFTTALTNQTGSASQDQGGWALSVSTSASAGFNVGVVNGQFNLSAGFAANHQEASQRWSSQVSSSAAEHAAQVNNSRRQSVESRASSSSASGSSTTTIREITNTNLRRVLNFVFRELNQTYETYVVLRDIKVAFYNGRTGSAEIVPLSDLSRLLAGYVRSDPALRQKVARLILSVCAQKLDHAGDLVTTLQVGTNPTGIKYEWQDAALEADGNLNFAGDVLASDVRWRIKPGELSKADRAIDGVIMNRSSIVLRTDNLVVEALLGQADALDPYGAALQALDLNDRQSQTRARDVETQRTTDALALVAAQDPSDRIGAWQKIFPDEPEIQVVPVATVSQNGQVPA
jgi:hypothetical protein